MIKRGYKPKGNVSTCNKTDNDFGHDKRGPFLDTNGCHILVCTEVSIVFCSCHKFTMNYEPFGLHLILFVFTRSLFLC